MDANVFSLRNFNVLEDDRYYYVYRALNNADHDDFIHGTIISSGKIDRIRTDRERWLETHSQAKYNSDSHISLEEMWNHIKMRYSKETNCISLSSNANVSLDYGSGYHDEYAVVRVPKYEKSNIYSAGKYMLEEIDRITTERLNASNIDSSLQNLTQRIFMANNNEEVVDLVLTYQQSLQKDTGLSRNIASRFQKKQYFNDQQQLAYNKIIAKATILELSGVLPSILDSMSDNSSLLATIGNAFSSGEVIHYQDIPGSNVLPLSKQMMNLIAITQQLKELNNNADVEQLEKRLIYLINHHYDIRQVNGKVVFTNGQDIIDCNLNVDDTTIFGDYEVNDNLMSISEIYNMTSGSINYSTAKEATKFCYYLALARRNVFDYAKIVEFLVDNNHLTDRIIDQTISINNAIVDRKNNGGYKICESVNLGLDYSAADDFITLDKQDKLIKNIRNLDYHELNEIIRNKSLPFRNFIFDTLQDVSQIQDKNTYYVKSIVGSLDYQKIFPDAVFKDDFTEEEKAKLIADLSKVNVINLYESFAQLGFSHNQISNYIINLLIEDKYRGLVLDEICNLDNLDEFVRTNLDKLNQAINPLTLNNYLGIYENSNVISGTNLILRDYQARIKNDIDKIYAKNRRFAGIVLPTGGGKSFIAMAEMLERKDSNIVYIAPRLEILRQFKKHIVKYVAGKNPEDYTDEEQDMIVKSCFPHLELYCYQGLDPKDEEKLKKYDADFIILDELHHVGAESWNPAIKTLLNRNPSSKVLGITATPVRDDVMPYDPYNGDVMKALADFLDDYTSEELNCKVYLASDINVIDAFQEGYVICPNIVSFDYYLDESPQYQNVLRMASREKNSVVRNAMNDKINDIQNLIRDAKIVGVENIFKEYIKDENGRYILFIPRKPFGSDMTTEEYVREQIDEFKDTLSLIDNDPHIEYILSSRGNKVNSDAIRRFETDDSDHIKILAAIDMLNEGVHLSGIKGSFNFRRIDSNHLILALQHLGRVIYALDPNQEVKEEDIPVVFDKFNIYFNLDLDRLVNRTSSTSDLQRLKDLIFFVEKYGYIPQTDSTNSQEQKKAIALKKIQSKYNKFLGEDLSEFNLSNEEIYELREILNLGKKIDLWNFGFAKINKEVERKATRINVFKATATQQAFLEMCNSINKMAGISKQSKKIRLQNLIYVLDYLAEYNVPLGPDKVALDIKLGDLLNYIDEDSRQDVIYELNQRGIDEDYLIGSEYYFAREELYRGKGFFASLEATTENIIRLRKYGLFSNGDDFTFVNDDGFIVTGPHDYISKNIWTGTAYSEDGYDIRGLDSFDFSRDGINFLTGEEYDAHGFDVHHIHKDTKSCYDEHGFDIRKIHKDTNDYLDPYHFDIDGYYYIYDKVANTYKKSYSKYDSHGFDYDGFNRYGFDRNGIHRDTGLPYDKFYFDVDGYYWKKTVDGRVKTKDKFNEDHYTRKGELIEITETGKQINRGTVYDKRGFYFDGTHYLTGKGYDERGFDKDGYWYTEDENGNMVNTGRKFNANGWTCDHLTIRHTAMGNKILDLVDDYGFDEAGLYHKPKAKTDQDGFVEFQGGTIYYEPRPRRDRKARYDIHGFDCRGRNYYTNTNLNLDGFDRNGFWYRQLEDGSRENTRQYFDPDGWTIDRRRFGANGEYSKVDERGFDSQGFYISTTREKSKYDPLGFDVHGIHKDTGTVFDSDDFDRDGYWYKSDGNGQMINTNSKFNDDGWSQIHTHVRTGRIVDEHGFNYLHLYRDKKGNYQVYDSHGFDYYGVHKTTGTTLNRNNFDIDGFYYKEVDGKLVNTGSKYDSKGLNIDRLDRRDFSANGNYLGRSRKFDSNGFDVNGIHMLTHKPYDLDGLDCYGARSLDYDKGLVEKVKEEIGFIQLKYIREIYEELEPSEQNSLLDSYDVELDDVDFANEFLEDFIQAVEHRGINEDESLPTEEDTIEFVKNAAINRYESNYNDELSEMANEYYAQRKDDGDIPWADTDSVYNNGNLFYFVDEHASHTK